MRYDSLFARLVANTAEPEWSRACWNWTAGLHVRGYARVNVWDAERGKSILRLGHRLMWAEINRPLTVEWVDEFTYRLVEPLPLEYDDTVDHLCLNRRCINPDHLRLLSRADNTRHRWGNYTDQPLRIDAPVNFLLN